MSDFDILIEEAFLKGVYIHLVLLNEQEFKDNGSTYPFANWENNPYNNLNGNNSTGDFFSSANSIKIYKNRLRYIHSRWGYSTSIASYGVINEPEFLKDIADPYSDYYSETYQNNFNNWVRQISSFLKNDAYPKHLISVDFAYQYTNSIENEDCIDFTNTHIYGWDKNIEYQRAYVANKNTKNFNKPFNITESGLDPSKCGMAVWYFQQFHNSLWSSIFHGSFTNSLNFGSEFTHQSPFYGLDYIEKYKALSLFLEDEKFNTYPDYYKPISNALNAYNLYNDPNLKNCPPPDVPIVDRAGFTPKLASLGNINSPSSYLFDLKYFSKDISTNFDDKLEVFALKKYKKVIGWVHLKDAYWYNLKHFVNDFNECEKEGGINPTSNNNPYCSPQNTYLLTRQDFNELNSDNTNISHYLPTQIVINNLECRGLYSVRWYSTHHNINIDGDDSLEDGGEIMQFYEEVHVDDNLSATINVPMLQFFNYSAANEPWAEDYAFKLTLKDVEGNNDSKWRHQYADDYNNEFHYVEGNMGTDMNGHVFYRDNNGNMSQFYWVDKLDDYDKTTLSNSVAEKVLFESKIMANNLDDIFYIGNDYTLQYFHWNGTVWNHKFANSNSTIKLSGSFNATQNSHIHFRLSSQDPNLDGNLDHYYWNGTEYIYATKGNLSYSQKIAPESPIIVNEINDVFYVSNYKTLQYFHWNNSNWVHKSLNNNLINISNQTVQGTISYFGDNLVYRQVSGFLGMISWDNSIQDYVFVQLPFNSNLYKADLNTEIAITTNNEIFYKGIDGKMQYYFHNGQDWVHEYADNENLNLQVGSSITADSYGKIFYATDYNNPNNYGHMGSFWNQSMNSFVQTGLGSWWDFPGEYKVSQNNSTILINSRGHIFYIGDDNRMQYYYWKNVCTENTSNRVKNENINIAKFEKYKLKNENIVLKHYPNPINDELNIDIISNNSIPDYANISIDNILGINMYKSERIPIINRKIKLNLNHLNNGIYFVNISIDGNINKVLKIVKK